MRIQARGRAKWIIIVLLVVALLTFIASNIDNSEDEESIESRNLLLHASFMVGPPTILAGIVWVLSYRRLALIELISPLMFLATMLSLGLIITTEFTGEVTAMHRYQFNFFIVFIDWTFALFLGVTWLWGFVSRIFFFVPTMYVIFFLRSQAGDE